MPSPGDLYAAPASEVTYEVVRQFVLDAEAQNAFTESVTFEAKEKKSGTNVAEAVAALANTDGGIVLVGVKDKDATGEDRIVGVPKGEHDSLASSLHHVIPQAMPEIIPVAMPGGEKLVLVLRIDADAVLHPVMVGGKVLYRIPGHSMPADRRIVLDLVARDQAGAVAQRGKIDIPVRSWQPAHLPLWPDEMDRNLVQPAITGTLRVTGGLTLPCRVLDRPWLDTRTREAALEALNNSPLRTTSEWSMLHWGITEAGATHLRFQSESRRDDSRRVESAAYLSLAGRKLSMVLGFRWLSKDNLTQQLGAEAFYWALLGSMITIASTCSYVAREVDAAEPADTDSWEAWLQPGGDLSVMEAVNLLQFVRDSTDKPSGGYFPPARTQGTDIEELDKLARDWLTYWVLDLGMRHAETWFAGRERPHFLRMPDLA